MTRRIKGLVHAELAKNPPSFKKRRYVGTRQQGLKYEKDVGKALPRASHGPWFYFIDSEGDGYCQPDFLLPWGEDILVLEAKRTDCQQARVQLLQLYLPIVRFIFEKQAYGVVIAKYLSSVTNPQLIADTVVEAARLAPRGIPTIHWLGNTPLT